MSLDILSSYSTGNASGPQPVISFIVNHETGGNPTHAVQVMEACGVGYGINNSGAKSNYTINGVTYSTTLNMYNWITARVIFRTDSTQVSALNYCKANGILLMVCSDTGFGGAVADYPLVQLVMPLGSNSHVLIEPPNAECNVVVTGSSTSDPSLNGTAYGASLSFFDTYDTSSSNSNGVIAGKLLYIKEQRSILAGHDTSMWDARYASQQTGTTVGIHTSLQGWGKIIVADAISYAGSVPPDPYPAT